MYNGGRIAVSVGDPAGVGPEIALKSLLPESSSEAVGTGTGVILVGDIAVLEAVRQKLQLPLTLRSIEPPFGGDTSRGGEIPPERDLPEVLVLDTAVITDPEELEIGGVSALAGRASVTYVSRAAELCMKGEAEGLVTGPINKEAIRAAGYSHIGHTEMLSSMTNGEKGITMFSVDELRIFFHSRHLSLSEAIQEIDTESILESLRVSERCLRSVGYENPSIALAALNPHASDGGLFGSEEASYLEPARDQAKEEGIDVYGPVPADSVFAQTLNGTYDAVLSLYHDQGHIAAKTYDFYRTVSITFGYPFLRTSVDHGTAFDIAWKGIADPVSMKEALSACRKLAPRYRHNYY